MLEEEWVMPPILGSVDSLGRVRRLPNDIKERAVVTITVRLELLAKPWSYAAINGATSSVSGDGVQNSRDHLSICCFYGMAGRLVARW